ncbi:hypothetical protein HYPSUDRAFT_70411 [Hypholoma sublateritium FD-334 SS-4]|uniref:Uncharacterized protein n=1 Tax=Hypholoma sublateritium (strain FD-334 SS-4) TaxID=945553 RepID=A0A0D2PBW6_HYPSF|nr:hypothetical protein HYPSUDRAFT_70411 [Hypholoma sublateritium FD-334 SS-4]
MVGLTVPESIFISDLLGGIFYGLYCVLFIQYLSLVRRNKTVGTAVFYPIVALFLGGTAFVGIGFAQGFLSLLRATDPGTAITLFRLRLSTSTIYSFLDLISQGVLIYRCWIVWGKNTALIIVPSLLATASFITDIVLVAELGLFGPASRAAPDWFTKLGTASFSISLATNAIVTAVLVAKLIMVHRELTGDGYAHGHYISVVIAMLIESGALTFVAQLIWVVLFSLQNVSSGFNAVGNETALACGIAPTAVIVRVAMGRSYETKMTGHSQFESGMRFAERNASTTAAGEGTLQSKYASATRIGVSTDKLEKGSL